MLLSLDSLSGDLGNAANKRVEMLDSGSMCWRYYPESFDVGVRQATKTGGGVLPPGCGALLPHKKFHAFLLSYYV